MQITQNLISLGMRIVCSSLSQKILTRVFGIEHSNFTMEFLKEKDYRWYAVIPHWPKMFHSNLEMVGGADDLLSALDYGSGRVKIEVALDPSEKRSWFKMIKISQTNLGATYRVLYCNRYSGKAWICNVGKFVMGEHRNVLFIRQLK